jgi:hypothetical protein
MSYEELVRARKLRKLGPGEMAITPALSFGKIGHGHQDAPERDQHSKRKRSGPYQVHTRPRSMIAPAAFVRRVRGRGCFKRV